MRDFLANDYLPRARDTRRPVGDAGRRRLYAYLIEQNTTLPLKADEVHQLGLSEVARITAEMEAQKAKVGFKGTLRASSSTTCAPTRKFQPQLRRSSCGSATRRSAGGSTRACASNSR